MATGVIAWSQTPSTNGTADSAVNFAEGMAPSQVNDSARGVMASVAKWRDDTNGSITTGGSSTAYSVTSNQGQTALTAGYLVAFCPHTTNGATVTLNVDGLGAKPLRSVPGIEIPAGVIVQGTPYTVTYYTTNGGEWILHGFYQNPYNVPIGGMMPYLGVSTPNANFVLPYGQAISRSVYATLFSLVSTTFGTGDGSATFNIPDLRGRLPVCLDNLGGSAAGRLGAIIAGTTIGATAGTETVTLDKTMIPTGLVSNLTVSDTRAFQVPISLASTGIDSTVNAAGGSSGSNSRQQAVSVASGTIGATFTDNAGGLAHSNMQPSIMVPWILRVI